MTVATTMMIIFLLTLIFYFLHPPPDEISDDHDDYRGNDYYEDSLLNTAQLPFLLLATDVLLCPLREYLFSLENPCAQEEKHHINDQDYTGDNPDGNCIQRHRADLHRDIKDGQGKCHKRALELGRARIGRP